MGEGGRGPVSYAGEPVAEAAGRQPSSSGATRREYERFFRTKGAANDAAGSLDTVRPGIRA